MTLLDIKVEIHLLATHEHLISQYLVTQSKSLYSMTFDNK